MKQKGEKHSQCLEKYPPARCELKPVFSSIPQDPTPEKGTASPPMDMDHMANCLGVRYHMGHFIFSALNS
jgi:hypothetical protein